MFRSTICFLILLRLAIGWHFLFEGLDKVQSRRLGPTEGNRPFSSAGYFREAPGPLGACMRSALGDPFDDARARLVPKPHPDRMERPADYMPPALERDWDDYLTRFIAFHHLSDDKQGDARVRLHQAKSDFVSSWLTWTDRSSKVREDDKPRHGIKKVKKTYPSGVVEVEQTVPERVADYLAALDEVRRTQTYKLWYFGKDVEKQRLVKAKADLEHKRADLMKDLDEKTTEMKRSLADVLTGESKANAEKAMRIVSVLGVTSSLSHPWLVCWATDTMSKVGEPKATTESTPFKDEVPPGKGNRLLWWLDEVTAYGLTIMGACLLLGLLTRVNSFLLAGFLLLTYLAVPAFPWVPVPPNTEGNYFYVNKNLIEMLALLVLATVPSGRWLGIDSLLYYFRLALFGQPKAPPVQPAGTSATFTAQR